MTGEVVSGRYRLERELGRGGMATVFLAVDLRLSRPVALKRMHPGKDPGRVERFRREAELAASLRHPNILEVHDFGEDAEGPFLVCEWVRGEDLRSLAARLGPVPPEAALVLGWELARALSAAHASGVVHRDVKPDNVLVAEGGPLKLADFGLAALEDQERLTSTGAVTGSLAYMAPERIDTGAFSPASDVYAVGVILFELVSGGPPHAGKGAAHLAASVMTRDAPSLTEVVPGTPESLSALVSRCLAREARSRPMDGGVLAAELEALLRQEVGPPAEVAREFLSNPMAGAIQWRKSRFQRLLAEGRTLLAKGEGARAAKVLNAALVLEPASSEVVALLRERQRPRSSRARWAAGFVLCAATGLGGWTLSRHHEVTRAEDAWSAPGAGDSTLSPDDATQLREGPSGARADDATTSQDGQAGAGVAGSTPSRDGQTGAAGASPSRGARVGGATPFREGHTGARPEGATASQEGHAGAWGSGVTPSRGERASARDSDIGAADAGKASCVEGGSSSECLKALARGSEDAGRGAESLMDDGLGGESVSAAREALAELSRTQAKKAMGARSTGGPSTRAGSAAAPPPSTAGETTVGAPTPAESTPAPPGTDVAGGGESNTRGDVTSVAHAPVGDSVKPESMEGSPVVPVTGDSAQPANPDSSAAAPVSPGVLKLTARPWAEVFVNGESRGYTPRVRELSLPAGTHHLRFANSLCDEVEMQVSLAPGETVTRDVVLPLRKAEVLILAPAGSRLFVDGREVGVAPLASAVKVEHGRHTVTARRAGAPVLQREVDAVAGRQLEVSMEGPP
ncbi:serine/threonine-protein kinase [Myxococcus fulvus]|uniref:serine/threonine-protein kinase n=1 Tax=Myxococcus fulvus TaxID=33 RepID=UPI00200AB90F|nr:serine/threonine-protein kinase [Myxococcus fulvus]MCK8499063.1 protein kinase [Myxococcus fulvus]